jgi:hypothetical protein
MRKQRISPQFNAEGEKQCTNCGVYKETSEYHRYKDGYKHFCKLCVKNYDAKEHDPKRIFVRKHSGELINCRRCEQYLPKSSFWKQNSYCKKCKDIIGTNQNLKKYKLTSEAYVELEKLQNGTCAICNKPESNRKRLSVDHDHLCCPTTKNDVSTCGKCIRGLICFRCNTALGMIYDDIEILNSMISYLSKK